MKILRVYRKISLGDYHLHVNNCFHELTQHSSDTIWRYSHVNIVTLLITKCTKTTKGDINILICFLSF